MGEQRKRDFYAIAQKHDILILSDDPYRALLLHYPEIQGPTPPKASPGFLALDVDGRVLDLSSFSKV
jgi:DNA-binding transcriptional MocR family regulator